MVTVVPTIMNRNVSIIFMVSHLLYFSKSLRKDNDSWVVSTWASTTIHYDVVITNMAYHTIHPIIVDAVTRRE